jgi:isoleucyl-tRNA synthetase
MKRKYKEYKELNLTGIGKEINAYWEQHGTFEKSLQIREGHKEFVFYEGPPSANGKTRYPPCNGACHQGYFLSL